MTLLLWLLGVAALFAAASVLALYSYGRFARQARGEDSHMLPLAAADTALDRLIAPLAAAHPGASGLAPSFDAREAFALRLASVRAAGRSLDIASYIWRDDMTGRLLARELMAAADRGVRVRMLLDDVNVQGFDPKFRALNGHPGIEVRLFNPVRHRGHALRRGLEMLLMAVRFNRRLHAKLWVADGRLAITGGRNIGDEYFGAPTPRKRPVRDADILLAGPLAEAAGRQFDAYWNSDQALPIAAFWRDYEAGLERFRARLAENAARPAARAFLAAAEDTALLPATMRWTTAARLVADPPGKALARDRDGWLPGALMPAIRGARRRVRLMTPYFVPGREGMAQLLPLAGRGVRVEVLTNALSATNHILVHGAYRRYRRPLLAAGVGLYEFAPTDGPAVRGEMLHAKGFSVDGRLAFIGSFNFDLRSAFLNIECGVLFEEPETVAAVEAEFARCAAPERAWRLVLDGRRVAWAAGPCPETASPSPDTGTRPRAEATPPAMLPRTPPAARRATPPPLLHEPGANAFRRGASWLIGHLPIHTQL